MNPRHRAVIVVFDEGISEVQANMMRNGMQMFAGVRQVVPCSSVPGDQTAARLIAQKELGERLRAVERERDELAAKVRSCVEALGDAVVEPVSLERRRSS